VCPQRRIHLHCVVAGVPVAPPIGARGATHALPVALDGVSKSCQRGVRMVSEWCQSGVRKVSERCRDDACGSPLEHGHRYARSPSIDEYALPVLMNVCERACV
jgi:hypothetical protein